MNPSPGAASGTTSEPLSETVAETFLAMLKQKGVDHLFINSGTDAAPMAEAYARQHLSGLDFPTPVIGTHENLTVSMAHGYTMVSGKAQAVMVHVTVGAANALCGVMNASRDRVPMLFMAGRSPLYEKGPLGARSGAIHWGQEMYDQGGMMRELVKWDYELRSGIHAEEVLDRGLALAGSAPSGPVYLTLPREVLAEETPPAPVQVAARPIAAPPAPDPAGVEALAHMIEQARCPILVTSASGRDPETVAPLAALCERFGIGIVEAKSRYVCAPADHPFHLGQAVHAYLDEADLLICLESDVPWLPGTREPRPDTRIAHVGVDPLFRDYPLRSFGGDLLLTSSAGNLFAPLTEALDRAASDAATATRRESIARLSAARKARIEKRLAPLLAAPRLNKDWLNHCLNEVLTGEEIVVNEYWVDREIFNARRPGSFFMHSTAAGLGWGMPAAVGAALAARDRAVICTLGDGSYLFANPAACHHAIAMHDVPLLTILCNNSRWAAVQSSTIGVYPEGYAAKGPKPAPLSDLRPVPDFEKYCEASGGHAERVTRAEDLAEAIRRGLDIVHRERRQVLLNVICE